MVVEFSKGRNYSAKETNCWNCRLLSKLAKTCSLSAAVV